MAEQTLQEKVADLSDLELAAVLCLTAQQHCIIRVNQDDIWSLIQEIQLIASDVLGLSCAVLDCSERTSSDEFSNSVLKEVTGQQPPDEVALKRDSFEVSYFSLGRASQSRSRSRSPYHESQLDTKAIANIVVAKDLDLATSEVQIQALELLRSRRMFTRTAVYPAPKQFLFIAVLSAGSSGLIFHLNDEIFLSHYHTPEDGFVNLEQAQGTVNDDESYQSSIVRTPLLLETREPHAKPLFPFSGIETLSTSSRHITINAEVKRYMQNVITFLRLHRAVAGGISSRATKHLDLLAKCLAAVHGLSYVTPSLVSVAVKKVYPHRIIITTAQEERSMQWGSELQAVVDLLQGVTPETIIEDVLCSLEVPL